MELGPLIDRTLGTVLAGEHAAYGGRMKRRESPNQ